MIRQTRAEVPEHRSVAAAAGLPLIDPRNGPSELAGLLVRCASSGDVLNAFLIAAGLRQVTEDHLEPDVLRLAAIERVLAGRLPGAAPLARGARAAAAGMRVVRGGGRRRRLRAFDARLGELVDALAAQVVAGTATPAERTNASSEAEALLNSLPRDATFRRHVLRPPACFRGFDQHPDDVVRLVEGLVARRPDRARPVAVVGLRTSGSYLAPLAAAALREHGYNADALTTRPCLHLPVSKRRALHRVIAAGGTVAVIDDPPGSGASIEQVAAAIERLGAAPDSVVLMLALFGDRDGLPGALAHRPAILLPWEEWSVHARLEPTAVRETLTRLRPGRPVEDVVRLPLDDSPGRGHVSGRYLVRIEGLDGAVETEDVFVRGAGLGYFGDHATAVTRRLAHHAPRLHGVSDGLLYREWVPEERRPARLDPEAVAAYVVARMHRLRLPTDATGELTGQDPVWEVAGRLAARAFGRGAHLARLAGTDAAMRALLASPRPSLIDGLMLADAFFTGADGRGLVKTKADERAFSNRDLACCDAAFDAAAAAVLNELDADAVRIAFERHADARVDRERWLMYELVALEMAAGEGLLPAREARRRSARAVQRWFRSVYLADLPVGGPSVGYCALDIDGVLETETLGFPSLSPAGAQALRSLITHGYRPLLASGRSIGEIAERCAAYGLLGGVAEYGAALYDARRGETRSLLSPAAVAAVERARAALAEIPGVGIGGDHVHTVRAWVTTDGRRGPLGEDALEAARAAAAPVELTAVRGDCQTDLVPAETDKGRGLNVLLELVEPVRARRSVALAVGDAAADLPMFAVADRALAPRNAERAVRQAGIRVLRRSYQLGLGDAVAGLVGHRADDCMHCHVADGDDRCAMLLALLAVRERGTPGMLAGSVRVWRLGRKLAAR